MDRQTDIGHGRLARRALIGAGLLLASCAAPPPPPPVPPPPEPAPVASPVPEAPPSPPPPAPPPPPSEPKRKKAPAAPRRPAMTPEMDERLAKPLLSLLEREAQIQNLEKKLDEAIQETVRSKAKLVSQESRAEAATNLAEAEVALKTLKGSVKGLEKRPEYAAVARLMQTSAEELKKENYGGSLYLTNQVKARLRDLQDGLDAEEQQRAEPEAGRPSAFPEFDAKLARLQALLSEKDAQAQKLQRKLDDTIQEAVRTKARLRSQESKAEAVSNLAEAETALKTFRSSPPGRSERPELAQVAALMKLSAEELKKENYSGTLYATSQVKAVLKDLRDAEQARDRIPPVEGEVLFALPLPLKIVASGKARERPAADAAVAWSVDRGASPVAVSYKGSWVRIRGEGERLGWIYYNLLAGP